MPFVVDTPQYRDLPQIPFHPEPQMATWSLEQSMTFHDGSTAVDDGYNPLPRGGMMRMQTMQRFLHDASPLTSGLLHANLNHGLHHQYHMLSPYPTPEFARHDSPDRTSSSGNSSYATGNEARSPGPYPLASYSSPGDYVQSSSPYPITKLVKQETFALEAAHYGGNVSLRDLELYDHQPEPEPVMGESDDRDIKMELDGTYEPDPDYTRADSGPAGYKESPDSAVSHSVRDAESVQPMDPSEGESSDADYTPRRTRARRRSSASTSSSGRQAQRRRHANGRKPSLAAVSPTARVTKRGGRGASKMSSDTLNVDSQRYFPCPLTMYGCHSTFSSKNEWKRHVSTQHIKLGFWRCDLCTTTVDLHDDEVFYHNDFNRKDLFTQHLRRMHAAPPNQSHRSHKEYPVNEDNITDHQKRCFHILRETPIQSSCLYCDEIFEGPSSWETRMEHIGRHLEKDRKVGSTIGHVATWNVDKSLEQWLLDEGIIALDKSGNWKLGDGRPHRQIASDDGETSGGE